MTDQEMKKLSRNDLLELLIDQAKEIDRLREELNIANQELSDRKIRINKAGSIAEAALQLNGVFSAAEAACAHYVENVTLLYKQQEESRIRMEQETKMRCERMVQEAKQTADAYWAATRKKVQGLYESNRSPAEHSMTQSAFARRQK